MRTLSLIALCLLVLASQAQNPDMVRTGYTFALPDHPGRLHFDAPSFSIVEASAKPTGAEFGLRGEDKASGLRLLAFLFLMPEEAPMTSEKCRNGILDHERTESRNLQIGPLLTLPHAGAPIALAALTRGNVSEMRAFLAQGDLCADIAFTSNLPANLSTKEIMAVLDSVTFDPAGSAGFSELFEYATVLFEHHDPAHAAPIYKKALALVPNDDPGHRLRRVTTDQASMAYGMAGDLQQSRAINQRAIESDPDYPLYYFDLACADAEADDATAARRHLEQAFARKANTLPGEAMPDPAKDDSILKLKKNKAFWAFVQTLH